MKLTQYAGMVALVILAIMGLTHLFSTKSVSNFGSTSCGSITCLSGGLRLVADAGGQFESDIAAVFASTVSMASQTVTGNVTVGGTLGVTGTTTLAQSIVMTEPTACIGVNATSTATPGKIVFSTAGATTTFAGGVFFQYGACN